MEREAPACAGKRTYGRDRYPPRRRFTNIMAPPELKRITYDETRKTTPVAVHFNLRYADITSTSHARISFETATVYLRKGDSKSALLDLVGKSQVLRLNPPTEQETVDRSQQPSYLVILQTPHTRTSHQKQLFASKYGLEVRVLLVIPKTTSQELPRQGAR